MVRRAEEDERRDKKKRWFRLLTNRTLLTTGLCSCLAFGLLSSNAQLERYARISQDSTNTSTSGSALKTHNIPYAPRPRSKLHQHKPPLKPLQFWDPKEAAAAGLHLIDNKEFHIEDFFSDSWLLNRENFLRMDPSRIITVEDGCFEAIGKPIPHPHSKMMFDWTDFSVEHISKWWKVSKMIQHPDPIMYDHTLRRLKDYRLRTVASTPFNDTMRSPLQDTIVMVAFIPYTGPKGRGDRLTSHAMAATLASLYKVGFGRIIVTSTQATDASFVSKSFRLVMSSLKKTDRNTLRTSNQTHVYYNHYIGNTELAYVHIKKKKWVKTRAVKENVPRGAIIGMQRALSGEMTSPVEVQKWLGSTRNRTDWKFVYLTEPDTLLHTKLSLLPSIRKGLENGLSFFPHRLQPLPHELDFPPLWNRTRVNNNNNNIAAAAASVSDNSTSTSTSEDYEMRYIPGHVHPFSNITLLGPTDSCCDGGSVWVGRNQPFCKGTRAPCGVSMWWSLGFEKNPELLSPEQIRDEHRRLVPYPLMRLEEGTGLVFGSTNHGRRCFPSKTPCSENPAFL
eukprot:scaffold10199_cov146-Cylindrotheca_fusiformis.AAC.33